MGTGTPPLLGEVRNPAGGRFLRTPSSAFGGTPQSRWASAGGFRQPFAPAFFYEATPDASGRILSRRDSSSMLSPPGNPGEEKLGVGETLGMSNSTRSVVLVGTVHRDPKGYAKLFHLLEHERPSIITVEISPYSRAFRARQAAALRARLRENLQKIGKERGRSLREIISQSAVLEIFLALREPYEWRAAKNYAERHGIELAEIDLSCYAEEKLSHLPELISLENVRALLQLPSFDLSRQVESQYARAKFLFDHPPSSWPVSEEVRHREVHMAEKIRGFARQKSEGKALHIGGWEHLVEFPQGKSLFGLVEDLQPGRILLACTVNEGGSVGKNPCF